MPLNISLIASYIGEKVNDISKLQEDTDKRRQYFAAKNMICYEQLSRYNACSAALIVIKENKDIPDEIKDDLCNILNSIKSNLNYDTIIGRQKYYTDLSKLLNERRQWYITLIDWLVALHDVFV